MKKAIFLFYMSLACIISGNTQEAQKDSIDTFIKNTLNKFKEVPSISIAVIKDNKPFFINSYGYSDVSNEIKATNSTVHYIASATKPYLGLIAAKLEKEGIVDLEKSIIEFAPIKNLENKETFNGITITDLLAHTSGIENNALSHQFTSIGTYTKEQLTKILEEETLSLNNNKRHEYSNFGYCLFELILLEEFGVNWKDYLEDKIYPLLKFNRTTPYISKAKQRKWNIAQPYTAINNERKPTTPDAIKNDATLKAAGGLLTSIEDAEKWLLIHMNQGKLNGKQVISPEVVQNTISKKTKIKGNRGVFIESGYALGWVTGKYGEKDVIYHSGGFDGYFTEMSFLPEEKIGIAIFSNESHFGDNVSRLIEMYVYDLLMEKIKSKDDFKKQIAAVEARIERTQKAFFIDGQLRSKRKWRLSYDFKNYEGKYSNEYLGTINITSDKKNLYVEHGISKSKAEASRIKDGIRVELRDKRPSELQFVYNDSKPIAVICDGSVYYKQ